MAEADQANGMRSAGASIRPIVPEHRVRVVRFLSLLVAVSLGLTASPLLADDRAAGSAAHSPWLDVAIHPLLSNRSLSVTGDSGNLEYSAPMQPGLGVDARLYPLAIAAPSASWAAPFGVHAHIARHSLLTEVDVRSDGRIYLVDIPTRFATSRFGVHYDAPVTPTLTVTPSVGLQRLTWALGYNPRLQSSYYSSLDVGLAVRVHTPPGPSVSAGVHLRPGVDTGTTVQRYGVSQSGFGFATTLGARMPLPFGLYAEATWTLQQYGLTHVLEQNDGTTASNDATDRFNTIGLGLGFRY